MYSYHPYKSPYHRPEARTADEKSHIICYLKFKVPFFESFDRDLVSLIGDKLEV
jgi:hypothetical protein